MNSTDAEGEKVIKKRNTSPYILDMVDRKIVELLVRYPTISHAKLGKELDMSASGARKRMMRPSIQRALSELTASAMDQMADIQSEAMRTLRGLLQSPDHALRMQACRLALQRLFDQQGEEGNSMEVTYKVKFGEQGQMFRQIVDGNEDTNVYPDTLELMK